MSLAPTCVTDPQHNPKAKFVFICHGPAGRALAKTQDFLRDLGFEPMVAESMPSGGNAVDVHVSNKMDECGSVIALATSDDKIGEYYQPRGNVLHEIGLAQKMDKSKIIYLKEKTCVYPSNIAPKLWGSFTQDNMEEAFAKIARELKGFGYLRVG